MKMMVLMLDDKLGVLSSAIVNNIPEDLRKHPTDPFAELEGRLRDAAGAAAYQAHEKATAKVNSD